MEQVGVGSQIHPAAGCRGGNLQSLVPHTQQGLASHDAWAHCQTGLEVAKFPKIGSPAAPIWLLLNIILNWTSSALLLMDYKNFPNNIS